MSLLQKINETTNEQEKEFETLESNIDVLVEDQEFDQEELCEAATQWLAKLRSVVGQGRLNPGKKQGAAYVLAALSALSNPEFTGALDEEGDIGKVLYYASSDDPEASRAALNRLVEIGRNPSLKTHVVQAQQAIEDPTALEHTTKKIQVDIEKVMMAKRKQEMQKKASGPKLGIGKGQSSEQSPTGEYPQYH